VKKKGEEGYLRPQEEEGRGGALGLGASGAGRIIGIRFEGRRGREGIKGEVRRHWVTRASESRSGGAGSLGCRS
jgi:hypothetical protein